MYPRITNSIGNGVHLRPIVTFGSGTASTWFGMMCSVCLNHHADVRFSTCPLNGTVHSSRSKPDMRSVVISTTLSPLSKRSRTLPTYRFVVLMPSRFVFDSVFARAASIVAKYDFVRMSESATYSDCWFIFCSLRICAAIFSSPTARIFAAARAAPSGSSTSMGHTPLGMRMEENRSAPLKVPL